MWTFSFVLAGCRQNLRSGLDLALGTLRRGLRLERSKKLLFADLLLFNGFGLDLVQRLFAFCRVLVASSQPSVKAGVSGGTAIRRLAVDCFTWRFHVLACFVVVVVVVVVAVDYNRRGPRLSTLGWSDYVRVGITFTVIIGLFQSLPDRFRSGFLGGFRV
eukprot:GHVU01127502.1.p2 GENE.GHVU01127502.1~~GHVU01127502.1.p2  ORF type:complete len:160 (-),score=7.97 GHVU01127502.1:730-1209(-)